MPNWMSSLQVAKGKKPSPFISLLLLGTLSTSCVAFVNSRNNTFQQQQAPAFKGISSKKDSNEVTRNPPPSLLLSALRRREESNDFTFNTHESTTKSIHLATSAATAPQNVGGDGGSNLQTMKATGASTCTSSRTYKTKADQYFQDYQEIPMPVKAHVSLDQLMKANIDTHMDLNTDMDMDIENLMTSTDKILIVGDVHGCLNELKALVSKASECYDAQRNFKVVILVGDLCNKGPYSAEVIRFVRQQKNWFSVRGNHDNSALAAALGDKKKCSKQSYEWVKNLSDEDVEWMSQLPYSITIPKDMLHGDRDEDDKLLSTRSCAISNNVIVVHAGLIPGVALEEQEVQTMTTIRNVMETTDANSESGNSDPKYSFHQKHESDGKPIAWAKAWNGPEQVIFGHDAKRGLQNEKFATGLDSGACYGKKLTAIILPDQKLVSVDSEKIYCPIRK